MTTTSTTSAWARLSEAARRHPVLAGAIALVGLLCALLIVVYVALQTETGRARLARLLEAALSEPGRYEVAIGHIEGDLPGEIRIDTLSIADGNGAWLTVHEIALDWNPLALLAGRVAIESATAREVDIARRPVSEERTQTSALPGIPPLEIAVGHVSIDALRLDEPLLGVAASLRATAELAISSDAVHARLEMFRTDAVAGHASAVVAYDPETRSLDLHAELSEPRGGLTARLLELPQLPAIELSLAGDGPAADWRGKVTVDAEDLASLDSNLAVSIGGGETRVAVDGTARPGTAWDAANAILGPHTEFAIALAHPDGTDRLSVTVGMLRSAAIDAAGSAELALGTESLEGQFRIATRDASKIAPLVEPVRFDAATLEGRLDGPLTHPAIELDAEFGEPQIGDWSSRLLTVDARLQPDDAISGDAPIRLTGHAALSGFRGPLPELNAVLGDSVRISVGQGTLKGHEQLSIGDAAVTGARARGTLAGDVVFATARISARGRLDLDDLSPLSERAGRPLAGRLATAYDVSYEPDAALSIGLDGSLYDARFDVAVAEALLGSQAGFAGRIERLADGRWDLSDVAVRGAGAMATGHLSIPPGAAGIDAEYGVRVVDLATLGVAIPGRTGGYLDIRGTARGPLANPALDGTAALSDAAPAGFAVNRLTVRYALPGIAGALTGRLELEAENALLPDLAGRLDFALKGRTVQVAPLRLTARRTVVSGKLAIPLDGPPISGTLTAVSEDLGAWSNVVRLPLAGKMRAQATLSAEQGRQQVSLTGSVEALALGGAVSAQNLSVKANVSDALGARRLAVSATTGPGHVGSLQVQMLAADFSGTPAQADVALRASGEYRGPVSFEMSGTVRRDVDRTVLKVARLSGEAMGAPVSLRSPAVAEIGPDLETVEAELALSDGTVRASLRRTPKDVSLEAIASGIPLAPFWAEAPAQVETARVDANAALSGPLDRPEGRFEMSLTGIAPGELEAAPEGLALTVTARLENGVLIANGRFAGLGKASAEIDGRLPVRLSLSPMSLDVDEAAPASGSVTYEGPIEPLAALAVLDRHRLKGDADIRLKLAGTLGNPQVEGRAELTAGRYENLDTGTVLSDIRLRARPDGDAIVIEEATASDGNGGRVAVTGEIGLGGTKGVTMALDAAFEKARLVRRDELTAVTSGTISLRGNQSERRIAGRLNIEEAQIRLISGTSASIVHIDVEETGTPPAGTPPPRAPKPSRTNLDLTLSMPKRVFVRGHGLESEWGGELHVTGTAAAPRLEGSLRPLRGRYDFLGKIFTLRDGSIDFAGAEQIDPVLDLSAERAITDMTAIVEVTGTARRPAVKLRSVPEVPQDEVLSRVLFNKSTGRLSATEAVQLAQAAAAMTGATTGGGVMDLGRRMLNLDVLEVKQAEEKADGTKGGETSIEAGKYLTDDVYIGVESGAAGATGATVEIEVTPRLRIEGDVGQKEKESIGLKWKRDY